MSCVEQKAWHRAEGRVSSSRQSANPGRQFSRHFFERKVWRENCLYRPMEETPDSELIARSRQGDPAAIGQLFERHYPASLRLARGILRSDDESQDAVQVAYFSAFRRLETFRGEASFKTWITRIVVNCCLMKRREAWRRFTWVRLENLRGGQGPEALACTGPTPEKAAWRSEIASAFHQAVAELPQPLREVYVLHAVASLSTREVAATLGLTIAAAKTRLFRARARVRVHLEPVWEGASPSTPEVTAATQRLKKAA